MTAALPNAARDESLGLRWGEGAARYYEADYSDEETGLRTYNAHSR